MLGHKADKATTILTNLNLRHLDGLKCNHAGGHPRESESKSLARWAWGLNLAIAQACWGFLQGASAPASERNVPNPARDHSTHRFESVKLGSKSRIFRDGGGKPSFGGTHPAKRPECRLLHVGKLLLDSLSMNITWKQKDVSRTGLLLQCIAEVVLKPQKGSPIPPEVVDSVRVQVASALSSVHTASVQAGLAPKGDILSQPRGQPSFLPCSIFWQWKLKMLTASTPFLWRTVFRWGLMMTCCQIQGFGQPKKS